MFFVTKFIQNFKNKTFLKTGFSKLDYINIPAKAVPNQIQIITITYNNETLLLHQLKLLQKNVTDNFVFIVADNSPLKIKREAIRKICKENNIGYVGLPKNPYTMSSSSHGICINWMYQNYISKIEPEYFGFIDHDIFPIKPHSLINILKRQGIYGAWQGNKEYWYLWAGLCFFSWQLVKKTKLNFMPTTIGTKQVDTGGANWRDLYSKLNMDKIEFPQGHYVNLREGDVTQSDKMEILGDWLHSFNGSYWMEVKAKENELNEYLKKMY